MRHLPRRWLPRRCFLSAYARLLAGVAAFVCCSRLTDISPHELYWWIPIPLRPSSAACHSIHSASTHCRRKWRRGRREAGTRRHQCRILDFFQRPTAVISQHDPCGLKCGPFVFGGVVRGCPPSCRHCCLCGGAENRSVVFDKARPNGLPCQRSWLGNCVLESLSVSLLI